MDLRAAYERLKVEPGTPAKEARRAYLKLLKIHKPETDPDGFKAIREAYEVIKAAPQWEIDSLKRAADAAASGGLGPDAGPPPEAPKTPFGAEPAKSWSTPKRSWGEQVKLSHEGKLFDDGPKDAPPPAPRPAPELPPLDPFAPVDMKTFYDRGRVATDAQRVQVGHEAVAAMPDEPEAYWMLHEALIVASRIPEAAQALRDAHARGLPGFLEPLLRQHPEELGAAELIEARQAAGTTLDALTVANAFLSRGDAAGASESIRRGIEEARRGNEERAPSIHMAVDFVLRLYRGGFPDAAREVFDRLQSWLSESGREVELGGSQIGATYALTKELHALPNTFPVPVLTIIARAILDGDPSFAHGELVGWLRQQPASRKSVDEKLSVYAPTLHGALRFALQEAGSSPAPANLPPAFNGGQAPLHHWPGPIVPPQPKKSKAWVAWLAGVLVVIGLRLVIQSGRSSPPPRFDIPTYQYQPARVPDLSGIGGLGGIGGATDDRAVQSAVNGICLWEQSGTECRLANNLQQALFAQDCTLAAISDAELESAVLERSRDTTPNNQAPNHNSLIGSLMIRHQIALHRTVEARCPTDAEPDDGSDPATLNEEGTLDVDGHPTPQEEP